MFAAGADFAVTNTTVSVTDSEEVLIQILDDPLYEDTTEMFTVIASLEDGVFGNRVRLIPSFIDINIEDNDVLPGRSYNTQGMHIVYVCMHAY